LYADAGAENADLATAAAVVGGSLHDTGEIQAIDATGMDRVAASQHYAKRTNYTFRAVKTTVLIDCETGVIL